MPLSEDEQRILSEIEQQLYETDPALAREVGSTTVYTHAFRNLKWATAGFFAGVAFMVFTLQIHYLVAFMGFVFMLGSAFFFEQNLRRLGRVGLEQMTQNVPGAGVRDYFGSTGERMREKFRRDYDENQGSDES
ncbi:MAG: DUF3040 domain-containing protein [Acidimicrobiales bacterium]